MVFTREQFHNTSLSYYRCSVMMFENYAWILKNTALSSIDIEDNCSNNFWLIIHIYIVFRENDKYITPLLAFSYKKLSGKNHKYETVVRKISVIWFWHLHNKPNGSWMGFQLEYLHIMLKLYFCIQNAEKRLKPHAKWRGLHCWWVESWYHVQDRGRNIQKIIFR